MFRSLLTALAVLCVPAFCQAAKVKSWQLHAPGQYEKARFQQAVISNEGTLRLSRELKPLAGIEATHIWDVVEDKTGNLYVATGDEGKLYKVAADGKVSVAYTSEDSQVLCLALGSDGSVYAGTGPNGHIVQVDPQGTAKVLCKTSESYVWALAFEPRSQVLYAGTGPKGRVYRVTPEGKAEVFCATRQEHILCLGIGPDGTLYAGTDKAGLVYRIDGKGKGFVLYGAAQGEVRSLLVTKDAVYAGTGSPSRGRSGGSSGSSTSSTSSSSSSSGTTPVSVGPGTAEKEAEKDKGKEKEGHAFEKASASGPGAPAVEAKESSKNTAAPAPSLPASGENSLYRIGMDGTVREIFREKALILCQLREDGHIFVGTGMQGQLFEIDEATRERSEIARLDHGQILSLRKRHDGSIVVGAGDPAKLYVLKDRYVAAGNIVSEVLDARLISKYGALTWRADVPRGTRLTVAVRSGNLAEPDDTWSDWSAEQSDPAAAVADVPAGRYLQYRVSLTTEDPKLTPALRSITLRYATTNQAPEVSAVEVPDVDASQDNPKKLKLKWTASDPNEDELTYSLYVRKDGWKDWVLLEDGLEKHDYEWDTTTTPSGTYQVKVVASDRKDNSAEEALTGDKVSEPFVVAHTPPTVNVKVVGQDGDQTVLEATATDPLVRLTSASFSVNGKKWINVFPADGLFDGKTKTFKFKTESLKAGSYVLVLRVRDAAANTGSGDVVFTVPAGGQR